MKRILIIDDDKDVCLLLKRFLERKNFEVSTAHSGKSALQHISTHIPDLALCDFKLDDMTGLNFLNKLKDHGYNFPVIIITGYSQVKDAVEVMKLGAYDYVTKPLFPDEILMTINSALQHNELKSTQPETENSSKKTSKPLSNSKSHVKFISGISEAFQEISKQIKLVAPTQYSVIISGESGSGKELIAQQIHLLSNRSEKPFIAIDCGAISRDLSASELFGHEKGAFTGADNQKIGSLELANGGTIFLDEISNLPYEIQVSLLRVIQERKIRRLGGTRYIDLDIRIIVASNEDLWHLVKKGGFREDLFHRFNEFGIFIPPLRDRKSDIMHFAKYFLQLANHELNKQITGFTTEVENVFMEYVWHGNLRELMNVIKRATLLSDSNEIQIHTLPFELSNYKKLRFDEEDWLTENKNSKEENNDPSFESKLKRVNMTAESSVIQKALEFTGHNKTKAAHLLKIDRKTLYNKIKQYNL